MVQVFVVLRCFSCQTFQVHQVKKTNKWNCKVCNEKQSILKTYGKGKAADCRRHVQKLNMLRSEKEQRGIEELQNSHPPEHYADTFTAEERQVEEIPEHPVVLAGKSRGKSKWTSFIEPEDEEEDGEDGSGAFTTDRDEFTRAQRPRKRSASDRGPHPLSSCTNLTQSVQHGSKDRVYPYSCVSQEMEDKLGDHTDRLTGSRLPPDLPTPDRYRKLDNDSFVYATGTNGLSDAAASPLLSSGVTLGTSPSSPSNHKDSMAKIKEDISRYKCDNPPAREKGGGSSQVNKEDTVIPKVSSKWTQFMCEEESDGEEEDELWRNFGSGVVSSGSTVAQYSSPVATKNCS